MAGVVMTSSSDPIYTDLYHSQFQYNSGANSSWASMTATGLPLCEKARHCVAQLAAQKNATNVCYINQMGRINSNSCVMGAAQLELADVFRCIRNEEQVSELNSYHNTTQSDNCVISATMASLPSITLECKSSGLNEIDSGGHGGHSSLINPVIFDAEVSVNPSRQPCIREFDVTSAVIFAEMETLSVIDTDFKAHTSQSFSQADSSIECENECCKMACADGSCGVSDCFASKSASSSDILQAYSDHQPLESTNLVVRCNPMLTASPPHDSLDDYSLSAINAGAALGCSNFSTRSMEASPLNGRDASATAIDHLRHIREDGISCNQNELIVPIEVPMMDDHGRNVCIQQKPHAVTHPLDGAATADDMNECILGATGITVPVCHEEPHYQMSGSHMKVMQREAAYAAAAMQPVDWAGILNGSGGARPKRRNVRISQDPQTVSARRRRERISDRIRVLQRMVPGGMKLDTASMLDEAIHYLKYLKSRVQALEWLEIERSSSSTANSISSSSSPSAYNGMYCNFSHPSTSPTLLQVIK